MPGIRTERARKRACKEGQDRRVWNVGGRQAACDDGREVLGNRDQIQELGWKVLKVREREGRVHTAESEPKYLCDNSLHVFFFLPS